MFHCNVHKCNIAHAISFKWCKIEFLLFQVTFVLRKRWMNTSYLEFGSNDKLVWLDQQLWSLNWCSSESDVSGILVPNVLRGRPSESSMFFFHLSWKPWKFLSKLSQRLCSHSPTFLFGYLTLLLHPFTHQALWEQQQMVLRFT